MEKIQIPRYIDDPPQLLFWQMDEFIPIGVGLVLGIVVQHAIIGCFFGMVIANLYRRYSQGAQDGMMFHALYGYGVWPGKSKSFINPFARRFIS